MKRVIVLVLVAAVAVIGMQVLPSLASTRTVAVDDNFFKPARLTVAKGATVTFVWKGRSVHNVVRSRGPAFKRCGTRTRGSCSRTLRTRGTYRLLCTIHGFRMKIVVS